MRYLARLSLALGLAALLAACQTGLPGAGSASGDGVTPNAVLGSDIEVTTLDGPLPDPATLPEAASTAARQEAPPPAGKEPEPAPVPAPLPETAEDASGTATPPDDTAPAAAPKSDSQIACERKRGQWMATGIGELRTCVFNTRDSGKRCTRESDCEGLCLARSGTCAPFRPMLGCNEILQDNGARVTLCIE